VVRLIAQHELTVKQIMRVAEVSRQSVFTYRYTVLAGGVEALLSRKWAPGRKPTVRGAVAQEFIARLEAGKFRQARDAQAWIRKRTHRQLTESGVRQLLRRLGGKLKVPRKSHTKKAPAKANAFKSELPTRLSAVVGPTPTQPTRLWGRRGVRGHAPYATRYKWGYLHEALEVDGANACELLLTPAIDRGVHAIFLRQIADSDPTALHVVIADQAGLHLPVGDARIPANLRLLPLPPYCPGLNPVERFGGLLKAAVSNRLYLNLRKLEDHIIAAARPWSTPAAVARLIHVWLAAKVNQGAPA
jgi:transposase